MILDAHPKITEIHYSLAAFIRCPSNYHFRHLHKALMEYQAFCEAHEKRVHEQRQLTINRTHEGLALHCNGVQLLAGLNYGDFLSELGDLIDLFPDQIIEK